MRGGLTDAVHRAAAFAARRPAAVATAVLLVAIAWLLSASLLSGKVLASEDVLLFQTPFATEKPAELTRPSNEFLYDAFYLLHTDMQVARHDLRSGHLFTWSPYQGGGDPLLASQQNAMLSPLNWPLTVFPFWQTLEWVALLKLLAAGLGVFYLLRALGLRTAPAVLGGVTFAFSAVMVNWLSHPHDSTYAPLPWLLLFTERLARYGRLRDALLVAVSMAAILLGGHPPSMLIDATVAFPWAIYRLAHYGLLERAWRAIPRRALLFAGGIALGIAIAAVVILPLIELSRQSFQISRSGGGGPRNMLFGFFAPELWGRPDKFEAAGGPYNYLERTGYIGVIPVLLAAAGFVRRPRGPQIFFLVAGALSLGLVIHVFWWTDFASKLPVLDEVNRLRYLMVCTLAGAVLAGYGLDTLLDSSRKRAAIALGVVAVVAVLPLLWLAKHTYVFKFFGDALHQLPNLGKTAVPNGELELAVFLRWALFALIGVAIVALVAWRPRYAAVAAALAIAFTIADVVSYNRGFQPAIPLAWADPPKPEPIGLVQRTVGHKRIAGRQEFGPNVPSRYGLRDARIYRPPPLERRTRLWQALGGEGSDYTLLPAAAGRLANLYAVRYAFNWDLVLDKSGQWKAEKQQPLVENLQALPRAWLAYSWRPASGMDDALAKVQAGDSRDDFVEPVVEGGPPAPPQRALAAAPVPFVKDGERDVRLSVHAARPAQLILDDTYYPGWKATVDGHDAPIHPANVAFRAVSVPAGDHTVRFSYEPASVRIGVLLSLLGIATLIAGFAVPPLLRRRRAARTQP